MYFDAAVPQGWTKGTRTVIDLCPADLHSQQQSEMVGRLRAGTQTTEDVTYFATFLRRLTSAWLIRERIFGILFAVLLELKLIQALRWVVHSIITGGYISTKN